MSESGGMIHTILNEAAPALVVDRGKGVWPWVRVEPSGLERAIRILEDRGAMKTICGLVGRDTGQELELTYLLRRTEGVVEGLRVHLPRHSAKIASRVTQWPALEHHEQELAELLGVEFEGVTPGRFLLPEDWVGHPLRKDYVFPESYHGVEHRRAPLRKEHQRP